MFQNDAVGGCSCAGSKYLLHEIAHEFLVLSSWIVISQFFKCGFKCFEHHKVPSCSKEGKISSCDISTIYRPKYTKELWVLSLNVLG